MTVEENKREAAMKWWNSLTFEQKFTETIKWLKRNGKGAADRHPNSLTGREIEEIHNSQTPQQ